MAKGSESLKAPYLRKPKEQLCASCHKKESDPLHNHSGHKNNSCLECHTPHGGAEKVLKESTPALCLKCHSKENFEHRPVSHFLSTDRAKNAHFVNNKISCITCHSPHGADSSKKILRPPLELTAFCASCHDEKAVMLLKNFHKRKWKK